MAAETLGQRQRRFARMLSKLIEWAYANGYELTLGEAWRPEWVAREYQRRGLGSFPSFHTSRCAIDLNLFRDGVWLQDTESHRPLGVFWESLGPDYTWGGRFKRVDGNHYSLGEGKTT